MLILPLLTTFWFWVVIIEIGLIIWAVNDDVTEAPLVGLVIGGVLIHFFSDLPLLDYLKSNYQNIILYVLYYLTMGTVWSVFKWYLFLLKQKEVYKTVRETFLADLVKKNHGLTDEAQLKINQGLIPDGHKEAWREKLKYNNLPPKAKQNKRRITTWMAYWFMSMLGTLLGDFLRQIYTTLYNLMGNFYDRLSNSVFGNVEE